MPAEARQTAFAPDPPRPWLAWAVVAYVALALGTDLLASVRAVWTFGFMEEGFQWAVLHARPAWMRDAPAALRTLDLYKLAVWLVIPVAFSLRGMDWGALGFRRWRRVDLWLLAGLAALGVAAVLLITFVPSLRQFYPSLAHHPAGWKLAYVAGQLVWVASWCLGWEFMHRYLLLRQVNVLSPRFGWLLVPVFEGAYHLTKLPLEAAGMFLIALVFTCWCRARRNILLPLLVHLLIELALPLTRVLF